MPIPTRPGISGRFAFKPELKYTKNGDQYFNVGVDIPQSVKDAEGKWHPVEPYHARLVMFGQSAVLAAENFDEGHAFIAEGWVRSYTDNNGQERDEFRASRIGHDNNLTKYTVEPSSRERDAAGRDSTGQQATQQDTPTKEPAKDPVAEVLEQRQKDVAADPAAAGATGPKSRKAAAR